MRAFCAYREREISKALTVAVRERRGSRRTEENSVEKHAFQTGNPRVVDAKSYFSENTHRANYALRFADVLTRQICDTRKKNRLTQYNATCRKNPINVIRKGKIETLLQNKL